MNKNVSAGAVGPNPIVVRAIFERYVAWRMEQETKSVTDQVRDEAGYRAQMQRQAGAQAKQYFHGKVQGRS